MEDVNNRVGEQLMGAMLHLTDTKAILNSIKPADIPDEYVKIFHDYRKLVIKTTDIAAMFVSLMNVEDFSHK